MCHETPLVERPSCSSTSAQVTCDQPWPPCSTACSPPFSPAAIVAALIAAISDVGEPAAGELGGDLARDQLLVDEASCPFDDELLVGLEGE